MCSVPVTFGGGSRMQYGVPSPLGLKQPCDSQWAYHFCSMEAGSKLLSMGSGDSGLGFEIGERIWVRDRFSESRIPNPQSRLHYMSCLFTSNPRFLYSLQRTREPSRSAGSA